MWIKSSLIALGFAGAMVASTNALAGQQADAQLYSGCLHSGPDCHSALRPSGEDTINRLNDPPIENGYAIRREILLQADAKLDGRIKEEFEIAHSAIRKIMKYHTVQACVRHCASARSTQPSGSFQSPGIAFQSTQDIRSAASTSTTAGLSSRSSRLPPSPTGGKSGASA